MENMKRFIVAILVLCLSVSLFAGCSGGDDDLVVQTTPTTEPAPSGSGEGETTPVEDVDLLAFEAGTILRMATG